MATKPLFADFHCHPNFKPYGQSFDPKNDVRHPEPEDRISLWHNDKANGIGNMLSEELNVAMYSQSHLAGAAEGGLHIICLSLGALERGFITINKPFAKIAAEGLRLVTHQILEPENFFLNLVTRFSTRRLDSVRGNKTYFEDLKRELSFVRNQEGKVFKLSHNNNFYTFRIASSGAEVQNILSQNEDPFAGVSVNQPVTLCIILSMEGLHNLDAEYEDETTVLGHAKALKKPDFPLFFVTFCHHFWNGLCGHAYSLAGVLTGLFDQANNVNEGFNELGLKVLMTLLDKSKGRRIYIDIKHMSFRARSQYFNLLDGRISDDLLVSPVLKAELLSFFRFNKMVAPTADNAMPPVIVSHTAVNGYPNPDRQRDYQGNFPSKINVGVENPFANPKVTYDPSINLYDDDLKSLGRFRCLIGIQLDMRRIAGGRIAAEAEKQPDEFKQAYLVWNQVIHMVETWDRMGFPEAWDRICIGSDLDGLVSPIDGLDKVSLYPKLYEGLRHYSRRYFMSKAEFNVAEPGMAARGVVANRFQYSASNVAGANERLNPNGKNVPEFTKLTPDDIVDKICSGNALAFMKTYFV